MSNSESVMAAPLTVEEIFFAIESKILRGDKISFIISLLIPASSFTISVSPSLTTSNFTRVVGKPRGSFSK
ncbi:MAG: hypothetical protein MUO34_05055 [Ignavibacteriaceae bacterium]|nr:hypothetical protein [Ignavibacteriaceae bacterium]